jgi:hypothetical protein
VKSHPSALPRVPPATRPIVLSHSKRHESPEVAMTASRPHKKQADGKDIAENTGEYVIGSTQLKPRNDDAALMLRLYRSLDLTS